MKHLDLFSGIGGFALAAQWTWKENYENVGHCEIEEYACKVYHKHFPESKCLGDIKKVKWNEGYAELVTGGFPCQPFSSAGQRLGKQDERFLWGEMLRAIRKIKPRYVIAENVDGIFTIDEGMVFEQVCLDLEDENYEVSPMRIPACATDKNHRRDRWWFIAHTKESVGNNADKYDRQGRPHTLPPARFDEYREPEPELRRVDDGLSDWMDRIAALGNAIVPQVAFEIFKTFQEVEKQFERGV
jgi:DNA (cytosine-5)-methyltransferase 1